MQIKSAKFTEIRHFRQKAGSTVADRTQNSPTPARERGSFLFDICHLIFDICHMLFYFFEVNVLSGRAVGAVVCVSGVV